MKFSSSFTVVMKTASLQLLSLACTLSIKIHAPECTKTRHFYFKNFLGRGHSPLPDPSRTHFPSSALTHAPAAPPHLEVWYVPVCAGLMAAEVPFCLFSLKF